MGDKQKGSCRQLGCSIGVVRFEEEGAVVASREFADMYIVDGQVDLS
jgi:hypothetical protein